MTNTPAQLVVDDLSIRIPHAYGDVDVVSGVSFSVERGECVGLVGESGCGKTLTGLAIVGLLSRQMVVRGSVTWRGEEMIGGDRGRLRAIRGSEIGMVYQDALLSLNPSLRVARQLGQVVDRKGREAAIDEMLARVALHDAARIRRSYPFELSGGERQRVLIAMGLAQNPALLVADEPTTALDQTIEAQVMTLIAGLRSESSLSLLLITHNIALVAAMASKIVVMYAGQVAEQGPTEEIIRRPRHPYTEGLISCIESLEARERPAGSIAGVVPPPLEFNKGCRFATRCERAAEDCLQRPPEGRAQGGGSLVACYHPLEVAPA